MTRQAQGDLFEAARREDAERWRARFQRADLVVPYRDAAGHPPGAVWHGWVCPDCGQVEANEFLLGNNHGWHPDVPGWQPPWPGRCVRLWLLANHAAYDARTRVQLVLF